MPKLTCVTTTYNEGPALLTSVRSVLSQSFADFQYVIVDDGSSSETVAVLAALDDPRIEVIRQANDGLSSARNRALEAARGDYICFLDADDVRPPWSFSSIARAIDETAPDLLLCPGVLHNLRGDVSHFYDAGVFEEMARVCPEPCVLRGDEVFSRIRTLAQQTQPQSANKVIRRGLLERSGLKFPNSHFFEDIFFHTNVIASADSVATLNSPAFTYFRRYQKTQITATASDLRFDILAVSKLTLESFARRPEFHDPGYRAAVFASCLKIVEWCDTSVSNLHRRAFRLGARALIELIDPLFSHLPQNLPPEAGDLDRARRYLATLMAKA